MANSPLYTKLCHYIGLETRLEVAGYGRRYFSRRGRSLHGPVNSAGSNPTDSRQRLRAKCGRGKLRLKLAEERKTISRFEMLPEGKPSKRNRRELNRRRGR